MTSNAIANPETKIKPMTISLWKVVFHNDDYTPIDFVTIVLMKHYNKTSEQANQIAISVHETGRAVAGIYTKEICLQKAQDTVKLSRLNEHPLLVTAEQA